MIAAPDGILIANIVLAAAAVITATVGVIAIRSSNSVAKATKDGVTAERDALEASIRPVLVNALGESSVVEHPDFDLVLMIVVKNIGNGPRSSIKWIRTEGGDYGPFWDREVIARMILLVFRSQLKPTPRQASRC